MVDPPTVEQRLADMRERGPKVDAEARPYAGRHADMDRCHLGRERVMHPLEDRDDPRRHVGPRCGRVETVERSEDALGQPCLERPAQRVEAESVRSATGLLLPAVAAFVLGGLAGLQRLHRPHRDDGRSSLA